jgi:hypothetical protein
MRRPGTLKQNHWSRFFSTLNQQRREDSMTALYKFKSLHRAATYAYASDRVDPPLPDTEEWELIGPATGVIPRKIKSQVKKDGYAIDVILVTNVNSPVPPARARKLKATTRKKHKPIRIKARSKKRK